MYDAKKQSTYLLCALALGLGLCSGALAGTTNYSGWYFGASASALWPDTPNFVTVDNGAPAPYNKDIYTINTDSNTALALNIGHEWQRADFWFPSYSLGLQYQRFSLGAINGSVTQYSLPQFVNYAYTWDTHADLFSLYTQIDVMHYGKFTPFVNLGIGLAANHAGDFYETAFPGVTPRVSPGFASHTQNNLAYNVGLGINYHVLTQWSLSLAYSHQYLGSFHSSNGTSTWSAEYLNIKNYQLNMLTLGVAYHF